MIHASPCPGFDACHGAGLGPACLPAASLADDIKPKTPETAFSGKLRPDILGISGESNAESARAVFDSLFKGRTDTKTDIQQQKFGGRISFVAALNFSLPAGPTQNGEMLSTSFSSPASANRAYFVARNLTFAQDQQPSKADMIKEVMGKYGVPTIVGDQHLYYIYRKGSIVSVGAKYKEATALEAIDKPLDPENRRSSSTATPSAAAAWPSSNARRPRRRNLSAMLAEAKGANCDGVLSVQLVPGATAGPRRHRAIHAARRQAASSARPRSTARRSPPSRATSSMPKGSAPKL